MSVYKPLEIDLLEVGGLNWALKAMRLPKGSNGDSGYTFNSPRVYTVGPKDLDLASRLVRAGDDHAKAIRGVVVWAELRMQTGWMIEFETYRHGVECMSTSSSMHCELKGLKGPHLAEQKQIDLPGKVYTRILTMTYQALRNMHKARRPHRHPDWQIMCDWIETLPYAPELICI